MLTELTNDELLSIPPGELFIPDCECYPNYFLIVMLHVNSGKCVVFESSPTIALNIEKLSWMIWRYCFVGFNSIAYDFPLIAIALQGGDYETIYQASMAIIRDEKRPSEIEEIFGVQIPQVNHVDLIQVAPLQASLKLYAGRLHCPLMQDLPIEPDTKITEQQRSDVIEYCVNDTQNTKLLMLELSPHLDLRQSLGSEYGRDMRSLSDAQVAETIIGVELHKLLGYYPKRNQSQPANCTYTRPSWLEFKTATLQRVLETVCEASFAISENGAAELPEAIAKLSIEIGASAYKMGLGGLHSQETESAHVADSETLLVDRDVASYYPAIILNQHLFPPHLGSAFLHVYKSIVDRRLAAKKAGNKKVSEGLKIAINGIFGKFGNRYSVVYSPDLFLQVTLTGQLALLMLIEALELSNIAVVSGNTDGIIIKCKKSDYDQCLQIIGEWESATRFVTEETRYRAVYSRDVNNYIAVKEDNTCKTKGVYCERGSAQNSVLSKNPEALIVSDAVQAFLTKQIPIEQTIKTCTDIRRFVSVRNVKGGAMKDNEYLGKAIRWYYARGTVGNIKYKTNGNKVAKSDGAKPLMRLPDTFPHDVNLDWYIREATETLFDIGYFKRRYTLSLF